jgi:hypothetical protein
MEKEDAAQFWYVPRGLETRISPARSPSSDGPEGPAKRRCPIVTGGKTLSASFSIEIMNKFDLASGCRLSLDELKIPESRPQRGDCRLPPPRGRARGGG